MPALKDLYVRVVQHKTDVIEHLFDPRWSPGMERGSDERARVSMGLVDREEGKTTFDTRRTEDPSLLLHAEASQALGFRGSMFRIQQHYSWTRKT